MSIRSISMIGACLLAGCATPEEGAVGTSRAALAANGTELFSEVENVPANAHCSQPVLMTEGKAGAYTSTATNFEQPQGIAQVYIHDRTDNVTLLVSVAVDGRSPADAAAHSPTISSDAGIVAFASAAANLATDAVPGIEQVYIRDRFIGATTRIPTTKAARHPHISGDGNHVCFTTHEALDPADTNGDADIYVYDRTSGALRWVSADPAYRTGKHCAISTDGSIVAYAANGAIVTRDLVANRTTLVARKDADGRLAMATDGSHVAFASANAVYVWTRTTGALTLASQGLASAEQPSLDGAGDLVAFSGQRTADAPTEIFTVDLATLTRKRVSVDGTGKRFVKAVSPYLADDGVTVAFAGKTDDAAIQEIYLVNAR